MKLKNPVSANAILHIGSGLVLTLLSLYLIIEHASAFRVGIGIALGLSAVSLVKIGFFLNRLPLFQSSDEALHHSTGFMNWLRTPKLYPNGRSYTRLETAVYMCICVILLAIGIWLMGWAVANVCHYLGKII